MDKVVRDNLIVTMRADGETISTIENELYLPTTTIKIVLQNHAYLHCLHSAAGRDEHPNSMPYPAGSWHLACIC
jgi:hypothetical protein